MGPAGGAVDEVDNSSERPQVHSPRDNHMDQRREASYDDRSSYRGGGYHAGGRGGYSGPPRYNSTPRGAGGRGSSFYPDGAPRDDVSFLETCCYSRDRLARRAASLLLWYFGVLKSRLCLCIAGFDLWTGACFDPLSCVMCAVMCCVGATVHYCAMLFVGVEINGRSLSSA